MQRLEIELFMDVSICPFCEQLVVGSGTPEVIFYSYAVQRVFRRQPIGIAAKIAARSKISIWGK
jgi:hypothetical protein